MKLDKVTITGADESIRPRRLKEISKEYPFVEWGILLSVKRNAEGGPRFPQWEWVGQAREMMNTAERKSNYPNQLNDMQWSAHLCGQTVRRLAQSAEWGYPGISLRTLDGFQRAQINFHGEKFRFHKDFVNILPNNQQIILQMDGINDGILQTALKAGKDVVPLYDMSHGAGVLPDSWPKPVKGIYNGYAGGLGPDNLKEQLDKIAATAGNERVWVDMETKVRSNDDRLFDLDKVVKCLDIAKEYMAT